jgi:TolB protein
MKKIYIFMISIFLFFNVVGCQSKIPTMERIFYLSGEKNRMHIHTMNIYGDDVQELNTGLAEDGCPVLSNSKQVLLFRSNNGTEDLLNGKSDIYLLNISDNKLTKITFGKNEIYDVALSPISNTVVYSASSDQSGFVHLFLLNSDGTNVNQLTDGSSQDYDPSWSPDGKKIIYSSTKTLIGKLIYIYWI